MSQDLAPPPGFYMENSIRGRACYWIRTSSNTARVAIARARFFHSANHNHIDAWLHDSGGPLGKNERRYARNHPFSADDFASHVEVPLSLESLYILSLADSVARGT